MKGLLANGTVNAAQSGQGPALFLFHSLLSDRASFDAIVPQLARSFRVIVPELPGFGQSAAVGGGLPRAEPRSKTVGGCGCALARMRHKKKAAIAVILLVALVTWIRAGRRR